VSFLNRDNLTDKIKNISDRSDDMKVYGTLTRSIGLTLEGTGFKSRIGEQCKIIGASGDTFNAVVTGFHKDKIYLMPLSNIFGLEPDCKIQPLNKMVSIKVSDQMLGRIIDGVGNPLDGLPDIIGEERSIFSPVNNPLSRRQISKPIDVGVRSINSLLTIGEGQRVGLMAGSGVGKSVLIGMIARNVKADVTVVGLIGERGREVNDFINDNLGAEGLKRSIVVASPADYTPVQRLYGAYTSLAIAEYFREKGKKVLLIMDSLTRFAQAQREIALAMGEPPATKGYPPSVFTKIPALVERAGTSSGPGSITGLFTVLAEGDDNNDPIVDACRAILDGHIVLSRNLADVGHFPAIDIEKSISRLMDQVIDTEHKSLAKEIKKIYTCYSRNKDIIDIGAYSIGTNKDIDRAIKNINKINNFLQQDVSEQCNSDVAINFLRELVAGS